jgi:hypothetical protein
MVGNTQVKIDLDSYLHIKSIFQLHPYRTKHFSDQAEIASRRKNHKKHRFVGLGYFPPQVNKGFKNQLKLPVH